MRIREQTEDDENFAMTALEMLAEGQAETPVGAAIAKALQGTRLDRLFGDVPMEFRCRASASFKAARMALQTEAAKQLFDQLVAEAMRRVRWRPKAKRVAVAAASAIALQEDAKAIHEERVTLLQARNAPQRRGCHEQGC